MQAIFFPLVAAMAMAMAELPAEYTKGPDGAALTEEDYEALEKLKILVHLKEVPGQAVKRARALALLDASPEAVFKVLRDFNTFENFIPYCKEVNVEHQEKDRYRVRFVLDLPWPLGNRHYVLNLVDRHETVEGKPVLVSEWTYIQGSGNINDTYGSWEMLAYGKDRTLVRYTVFTDPGGKLPTWVRNFSTTIAVPKVIKGLRKEVARYLAEGAPSKSPTQQKE